MRNMGAIGRHINEANRSNTWRRSLEQARDIAMDWTTSAPRESRAHIALGEIYLFQGRVVDAEREFALVGADLSRADSARVFSDRLEVALKRGRGVDARRLVESWSAGHRGDPISWATPAALLGRLTPVDSLVSATVGRQLASPIAARYYQQTIRQVLGVASDSSVVAASRAYNDWKRVAANGAAEVSMQLAMSEIGWSLFYGRRPRRSGWPFVAPLRGERPLDPLGPAASHDMAGLYDGVRILDSLSANGNPSVGNAAGDEMVVVDAYLTLGDSAAALRQLRHLLDTTLIASRISDGFRTGRATITAMLWPRAMVLRAELAAARGARDEAREWYGRFLDLWATADAEGQALVSRVRAANAAIGGPRRD